MTVPTHGGRAVAAEPTGEAHTTAPPPHHPRRGVRRRAGLTPRRRVSDPPVRLLAALLALALLALTAAACGAAADPAASSGGEPREISVFAASSLTDAFTQLGGDFTAAHPGVTVTFNFAGSNDLAAQLQQGAPADVLATADTGSMDDAGSLSGAPQAFAGNKLIVAVAPGNPERITGLADLARDDLKVVLAAPEVPAGKYAQEVLARAGVRVKPVSLEVSVKGVVTKVSLGEADAGIVYVTDVDEAQGKLEGVAIPDAVNVIATYPVAVIAASEQPEDARAFVDLVLSAEGQTVLADHGFLPAP
jgi:molybdate transport system substrate-binding protein